MTFRGFFLVNSLVLLKLLNMIQERKLSTFLHTLSQVLFEHTAAVVAKFLTPWTIFSLIGRIASAHNRKEISKLFSFSDALSIELCALERI